MRSAEEVLEDAKQRNEKKRSLLRDAAEWFHDREGEMLDRKEAVEKLSDDLGIEQSLARELVASLVSDLVDPVVQELDDGEKLVGIKQYFQEDKWYGYIHVDDIEGEKKRLVCAHCVNNAEKDHEVVYAEEGTGSLPENVGWEEMKERMREHLREKHFGENLPGVETGATLLSGTTIGGNTAWHLGNDDTGLDADKLDGTHHDEFGKTSQAMPVSGYLVEKEGVSSQVAVSFSTPGSGGGATGLGFDGNTGCIWHANQGSDSIFRMDQKGNVDSSFGSPAFDPEGLEVNDNTGCLWNVDSGDEIIYRLDQNGNVDQSFRSPAGPCAWGMGVDSNGCLWHTDLDDSIYKLRHGVGLADFGSPGPLSVGVGVDTSGGSNDGCIWNADDIDNSIYRLDQNGNVDQSFASPGSNPEGLGVDSSGCLWNADENDDSIYKLDPGSGTPSSPVDSFGSPGSDPEGLGVDSSGCLWNADASDGSIYKLDPGSGTPSSPVDSFGSPGSSPTGVGVDRSGGSNDGCLWHADGDTDSESIYKLDPGLSNPGANPVKSFPSPGSSPQGLGVDSSGCLWHADSGDDSIYKFRQGVGLAGFGSPGSSPLGLGVDSSGCLWLSESSADSIYRLDRSGNVDQSFARPTSGFGGLGVDPSGFVWNPGASDDSIYRLKKKSGVYEP